MLPVVTLVLFLGLSAALGRERWQSKTTKYVLVAGIALLQTILTLIFMYTMKVPKGTYLP